MRTDLHHAQDQYQKAQAQICALQTRLEAFGNGIDPDTALKIRELERDIAQLKEEKAEISRHHGQSIQSLADAHEDEIEAKAEIQRLAEQ